MAETAPEPDQKPKGQPAHGSIGRIRIFGIPIRLHFTFLLLLVFLVFIGVGGKQSGLTTALYIAALFASVLLHEIGHALVARWHGVRTTEIVMYPIGGVSRLEKQPAARQELLISIAGPLVNLLLGIGLLASQRNFLPVETLRVPTDANLIERIAVGNLLLGVFNLLPAYPMDGGRILRSLIALRKSEDEATEIAASAGRFLAVLMGLAGLLWSNFLLLFVALFVYLGAAQEGAAARGRSLTSGFPVRAAMITDFRTLSHGNTIREAGDLLLATSQQDFPVMHGDEVIGLLSRSALIRAMMRDGPDAYVAGAMDRNFVRLPPDMELAQAMAQLSRPGSAALVMDDNRLMGMLTSENLYEFMLLRQVSLAQARTGHH
ncbi:MAG TPA: site-2 protease family protein [Bryobacteraceae bacterium]|nr:site-2 protease family protein [Bryobacteraceae bacterium]